MQCAMHNEHAGDIEGRRKELVVVTRVRRQPVGVNLWGRKVREELLCSFTLEDE